jgi:hypothetical protein
MAVVVQTEDFTADVFPFKQPVPYDVNLDRSAAVPFGQAIVNEQFAINSTGAGDDASVNIGMFLPPNYCSMLRSLHFQKNNASVGVFGDGNIGLAYQNPGGPYGKTMAALPESDYLWWSLVLSEQQPTILRDGSTIYFASWAIADKTTNTTAMTVSQGTDSPMNVPLWVDPTYPGRTAVINLTTIGATNATSVRLNAVFDLFTYEQAHSAEVMSSPRRLAT